VSSDARAQQARSHNQAAAEARELANRHQDQRDRLIVQLRTEDPARWSYAALAKSVGVSPELIAAIVKGRTRRRPSEL
jgi:hypothetical protein